MAPSFAESVKKRTAVWKAVLWRRLVIWLTASWTVFSNLATLRDNFLPEKVRDALQPLKLIPQFPWWAWVLGVLAILVIAVMEGAYQEIERRDAIINAGAPRPRVFSELIQVVPEPTGPSAGSSDINLRFGSSAADDWFTVEVVDVRPRAENDSAQLPWFVRWSDTHDQRRHTPQGTAAILFLCGVESTDKNKRLVVLRFFTPTEDRTTSIPLAGAWTEQGNFIGYWHVPVEVDLRITATKANRTTGRRVELGFDDSLGLRVHRVDVL